MSNTSNVGSNFGDLDTDEQSDNMVLQKRVAMLEEQLRRHDIEARELRSIISTKDNIIRNLGARLAEVESTTRVAQTKHEIIRELGLELGVTKDQSVSSPVLQSGDSCHKVPNLHESCERGNRIERTSSCSNFNISQGLVSQCSRNQRTELQNATHYKNIGMEDEHEIVDVRETKPFTVLPINDHFYQPIEGNIVDQRIASFSNSRRCKILFTRIDDDDNYLYGRLVVHCSPENDGEDGVSVSLQSSGQLFALSAFVELYENAEHEHFEHVFNIMFQRAQKQS